MSLVKFLNAIDKGLRTAAKASTKRQADTTLRRVAVPVLTADMLTPEDKAFTHAEIVKLYAIYLRDAAGIVEDADVFEEEFKTYMENAEQELVDQVDNLNEEYKQIKLDVNEEKKEMRNEMRGEYTSDQIQATLALVDEPLIKAKAALDRAKAALASFKAGRRHYLVAYINNEFQGTPMPQDYPSR